MRCSGRAERGEDQSEREGAASAACIRFSPLPRAAQSALRLAPVLVSHTALPQLPPHGSAAWAPVRRVCRRPCRHSSLPPSSSLSLPPPLPPPSQLARRHLKWGEPGKRLRPAPPSQGKRRVPGLRAAAAAFCSRVLSWLLKLNSAISCSLGTVLR